MRRLTYIVAGGLLGLACIAALSGYFTFRASLPKLDGRVAVAGLAADAAIERDASGTPTIRAKSRRDLAFATGFAHAQDRFFQMDLSRRAAAGELSALLGASVLDTDKRLRLHAFRRIAHIIVANATQEQRALLGSYSAGVNAGLAELGARPWEYLVLRAQPDPWTIEDSILTAFALYLNLNDSTGEAELNRGRLHAALPADLFAFLHPHGTEWDAPVVGGTWRPPGIPGPEVFDLRQVTAPASALRRNSDSAEPEMVGSNSWAVAGTHAAGGAALLANDMHLALRLPHVWYRARLIVDAEEPQRRDLVGVTLPGLPILVVGSNGHVAWGYTNSYGDWTDLVTVNVDPRDASRYLTPAGPASFEIRSEEIAVRGAPSVTVQVRATRWGPIVGQDDAGRPLALVWTAHDPRATNMRMLDLEAARTAEESLAAANRAGTPVQNFVAADSQGHIGWSLMGQVPVRSNYDATVPASWHSQPGWVGWREPDDYPRIVDPASGRLWTANARTIDADTWLPFMGDGGYDLGARAAQIRDDLLQLNAATAADMVKIQLDDRALFLTRWRDLLLELLNEKAIASDARRAAARRSVEDWSARAASGDVGYAIVREFRLQTRKRVFEALVSPARARYQKARFAPSAQFEAPLWMLVTRRPSHLLDPAYPRWEEALLAYLDAALDQLASECHGTLDGCTWGRHNTLAMKHPLSDALPFASSWLDMPAIPLSGDAAMPHVQGVSFGASQRLVVSPGRESEGFLQLPGGPVDHPLSPFYGAGHDAWARGEPTPLLPGPSRHTLQLTPQH